MIKFQVMQLLAEAQRRFPDQRTTQIIFNAVDAEGEARRSDGSPRDLFYVTDEVLVEGLRKLLKT